MNNPVAHLLFIFNSFCIFENEISKKMKQRFYFDTSVYLIFEASEIAMTRKSQTEDEN